MQLEEEKEEMLNTIRIRDDMSNALIRQNNLLKERLDQEESYSK
jgi:C4-type Zn-finger protein